MASIDAPAPIGDVVRALARSGAAADRAVAASILQALGWRTPAPLDQTHWQPPGEIPGSPRAEGETRPARRAERVIVPSELRPLGQLARRDRVERPMVGPLPLPAPEQHCPVFDMRIDPLLEPRLARSLLGRLSAVRASRGELDVAAVVATIARGGVPTKLPRRSVSTLAPGLQLLVDVAPAMQPFYEDTTPLLRELRRTVGSDRIEVLTFETCPEFGVLDDWTQRRNPYVPTRAGKPVLAVTDLGLVRANPMQRAERVLAWLKFRRRLAASQTPLSILAPYREERFAERGLTRLLRLILWDRGVGVRRVPPAPIVRGPDE